MELRDPVYGFIFVNELERDILNSFAFQRLRRIKQLGLTDMIYHGANHNRFEHSIGVMHLASQMFDAIISREQNRRLLKDILKIDDTGFARDRQLVRLAALLHDVGHAPFSHASEDIMPHNPRTGKPYQHEDYSVAVIDNYLKDVIEKHDLNQNYHITVAEIAALITGNKAVLRSRAFWKVLISSQLDADRSDYLMRDSLHIGVKYGIYDYHRLLNVLAVAADPASGSVILGLEDGGWHVAESVVIARYHMFKQVYFHRVRCAYDYHLKNFMAKILPNGKLPAPTDSESYLTYDDVFIWHMLLENRYDVDAQAILNRNYIRRIFSLPDIPSSADTQQLERVKMELNRRGIWFEEIRSEKLWYSLFVEGDPHKEIMIIDERTRIPKPLSFYSPLIQNIGAIRKSRLYVKPEDSSKAEAFLQDIQKKA